MLPLRNILRIRYKRNKYCCLVGVLNAKSKNYKSTHHTQYIRKSSRHIVRLASCLHRVKRKHPRWRPAPDLKSTQNSDQNRRSQSQNFPDQPEVRFANNRQKLLAIILYYGYIHKIPPKEKIALGAEKG